MSEIPSENQRVCLVAGPVSAVLQEERDYFYEVASRGPGPAELYRELKIALTNPTILAAAGVEPEIAAGAAGIVHALERVLPDAVAEIMRVAFTAAYEANQPFTVTTQHADGLLSGLAAATDGMTAELTAQFADLERVQAAVDFDQNGVTMTVTHVDVHAQWYARG